MKIIVPDHAVKIVIESKRFKDKVDRRFMLGYFNSEYDAMSIIKEIESHRLFLRTKLNNSNWSGIFSTREVVTKGVIFENKNDVLAFLSSGVSYEDLIEQIECIGKTV